MQGYTGCCCYYYQYYQYNYYCEDEYYDRYHYRRRCCCYHYFCYCFCCCGYATARTTPTTTTSIVSYFPVEIKEGCVYLCVGEPRRDVGEPVLHRRQGLATRGPDDHFVLAVAQQRLQHLQRVPGAKIGASGASVFRRSCRRRLVDQLRRRGPGRLAYDLAGRRRGMSAARANLA